MNFLAHSFISRNHHDHILLGNFFGDSFKGNIKNIATGKVQLGVRLHRNIDRFTDSHENVLQAIRIFRDQQGMFSPVVVDMVFDHLLAKNWLNWSDQKLGPYTQDLFSRLKANEDLIPPRGQLFFPHMSEHNWLLHYSKPEGLHRALSGLDRRVKHPSEMAKSLSVLAEVEEELTQLFNDFFPQLIAYSEDFMAGEEPL